MIWHSGKQLADELARISMKNVFNPYRDRCSSHDLVDAPAIRRANLARVVDAAIARGCAELWVGLELGARGGRRTGLPLTDEFMMDKCRAYWGLTQLRRATRGDAIQEQTSRFVWSAVSERPNAVFFWNAFPFHSHMPGSITNRGHTLAERLAVPPILPWLVEVLGVNRIVTLGRSAERAVAYYGLRAHYVRHPGRGGGAAFLDAIRQV